MNSIEKIIQEIKIEIKNNPAKIFGWIYPYILVIGLGVGIFYLNKINKVEKSTIPPGVPVSNQTEDLPLIMPSESISGDISSLTTPTDDLINKGKSLFSASCVACHGADGKGDGVAAPALNPKPRNFTSKDGWINGAKLSGIYKTLSEGITGSAMVAFDNLSPVDKFALAHYIRKTFVTDPPQDSPDEITALVQTYHLGENQKNPGQIPIKDAMRLVINDNQMRYQNILNVLNNISNDSQDGAAIFKRVTDDKAKALITLSGSTDWHKSEQTFVDIIVNNVNQDGFNGNVYDLSKADWNTFYTYMNKFFER
ncbi:MAG: c-type cytochrome [Ignavibacteriaceae bacterium]